MRIFFDIVGGIGLLSLAVGALLWFAPSDNPENAAMAHFIALLPLALGAFLCLVALIGRIA